MERDAVVSRSLRTPRAAAIAGILFALLLTAALVLVRVGAPPDSGDTGAWLTDHPSSRRLVALALHLVPFAGIAFLWFIGVVRDRIGQREDRFFATVFLGSGLLFVGMLFVATAVAAGLLAGAAGGTGAPNEVWGHRLVVSVMITYAMRMAAVFTFSTATIGLRTGFMPRWIGWSGYAIAAVLLLAIDITPWVRLLFPLWILLLSLDTLVESLGRRRAEGDPPRSAE
jgi:hypothetical protein